MSDLVSPQTYRVLFNTMDEILVSLDVAQSNLEKKVGVMYVVRLDAKTSNVLNQKI